MNGLIVAGISIRQDEQGRYCLNDLHKAAGSESKHQPANWLANQQTKELVLELTPGIPGVSEVAPISTVEGRGGGTYVAKELVYSYAMWISAAFNLKVIRGYDAMIMASVANEQQSLPAAMPELQIAEYAARMLRMSETSVLRMMGKICEQRGIPSGFLPAYTDEQLTRSLTDLLKEHGSNLSAIAVNRVLADLGVIEELTRPSTGKKIKRFKSLTQYGLRFGKNETSPENPRETQPRYFVEQFHTLLEMVNKAVFIDAT